MGASVCLHPCEKSLIILLRGIPLIPEVTSQQGRKYLTVKKTANMY